MRRGLATRLRWRLEAAAAFLVFALFRLLGPVAAAALGAAVARALGPGLPVSRVGLRNLEIAFPERDAAFRAATLRAMWDNLGRTVAELPNLKRLSCTTEGAGHIAAVPKGAPLIFVSAHLANWEVLQGAAARAGRPFAVVYRAIGNPHIDAMVRRFRAAAVPGPPMPLLPKGAAGARGALAHLRGGGALAMLVDQKMNDGIAVPLFGRPAMTAPAAAQLALRFGCPVIPGRVLRDGAGKFRAIAEAPIPVPATGDRQADIEAMTAAINATLERWIRERPGEFLWLHRRFEKSLYREPG
jgi:KDO2-lipid IV(A) lauroyltransferase